MSYAEFKFTWTIPYISVYEKRFAVRFKVSRTKTNTGGLLEYSKASERKRLKEFGKKTTRNLGRWVAPI